jgi:hypothetical protein
MEMGARTLVMPIDDSGHLQLVLTPHSNGLMLAELALEQIVQHQAMKMVAWKSRMPALFYSPSAVLLRQTTTAIASGLLSKIVSAFSFSTQLSDHLLNDCIFVACPQVLDGALEVVRRPFLWNRSLRVFTDTIDDVKARTSLDAVLSNRRAIDDRCKIAAALLRDSAFADAVIAAHNGGVLEQFIVHQLA